MDKLIIEKKKTSEKLNLLGNIVKLSTLLLFTGAGAAWFVCSAGFKDSKSHNNMNLSTNLVTFLGPRSVNISKSWNHQTGVSVLTDSSNQYSRQLNYDGMVGLIVSDQNRSTSLHLSYNNFENSSLSITRQKSVSFINVNNLLIQHSTGTQVEIQKEQGKQEQKKTEDIHEQKIEIQSSEINKTPYEIHLEKTNYKPGPIERHFDYSNFLDQEKREQIEMKISQKEKAERDLRHKARRAYASFRDSSKIYGNRHFGSRIPLNFESFCYGHSVYNRLTSPVMASLRQVELHKLHSSRDALDARRSQRESLLNIDQQNRFTSLRNFHKEEEGAYNHLEKYGINSMEMDNYKSMACRFAREHESVRFEEKGISRPPELFSPIFSNKEQVNNFLRAANAPLSLDIFTNPVLVEVLRVGAQKPLVDFFLRV